MLNSLYLRKTVRNGPSGVGGNPEEPVLTLRGWTQPTTQADAWTLRIDLGVSRMNLSLTPNLEALVQEKVASGLYNKASKVVREALRLMHDRDKREVAKLERLRQEAALGCEALDRQEFSTKRTREIAREAEVSTRHTGK
jgi:antitoxin ParD1/3/4